MIMVSTWGYYILCGSYIVTTFCFGWMVRLWWIEHKNTQKLLEMCDDYQKLLEAEKLRRGN